MDPAGSFRDKTGQGIDVGVFQLACSPVVQDAADNFMLGCEPGQYLLIGGVLTGFGFFGPGVELEDVEEDLTQLLGRIEIEVGAGQFADALGKPVDFSIQFLGKVGQSPGIDADAGGFHFGQNRYQGRLHFPVNFFLPGFLEQGLQGGFQLESDIRVLRRIVGDLLHWYIDHGFLVLTFFTNEGGYGNGVITEH